MRDFDQSTFSSKFKDNDLFQQAKLTMTKAHMKYLQLHLFRSQCAEANFKDVRIAQLMDLVAKVYCLEQLLEDGAAVYDTGFLAPGSYRALQKAMELCVKDLRPQFLPLLETSY